MQHVTAKDKRNKYDMRFSEELYGQRLSEAEKKVLCLCCDGLTDSQIAEKTSRSNRTIETQVAKAMRKLGAKTRFHMGVLFSSHEDSPYKQMISKLPIVQTYPALNGVPVITEESIKTDDSIKS